LINTKGIKHMTTPETCDECEQIDIRKTKTNGDIITHFTIKLCPLHRAAPKLLEAAQTTLWRLDDPVEHKWLKLNLTAAIKETQGEPNDKS